MDCGRNEFGRQRARVCASLRAGDFAWTWGLDDGLSKSAADIARQSIGAAMKVGRTWVEGPNIGGVGGSLTH